MNKCNKCKPCGCKEASVCGCDIKLDLLCAFYSGQNLQPLGINTGMDGNTVIKIINDYIKNVLENIELDPTIIESIGNGAEIYKGLSGEYKHQIKSLIQGEGIIITEQDNTITLSIDPDIIPTPENPFVGENVGVGQEVFVNDGSSINKFRRIGSVDNSITPSIASGGGINLKANFPIENISSIGGGIDIYNGMTGTTANIRTLEQGDGITIENNAGVLKISAPTAPDDTIKSFYVNETYAGTGNGSILRPYQKLTSALRAVIGTGSIINPQYKKAKIILQTNVTVSASDLVAQPLLENKISVNSTTIMSEDNYMITYQGTTDYPISTAFLNTKANITTPVGNQVYLTFDNVTIYSETVKGLVELETSNNVNFITGHNFNDFTVDGVFNPSVYTQFSPPVTLFGIPVLGQSTAISNTTPLIYISGFDANSTSNYNMTGYFIVKGTSQTFMKVENTAIVFDVLDLEQNPFFVSVDTMINKNPKLGIYRLEVINSYIRIKELRADDERSDEVSGNDIFIKYSSGSYAGGKLIIDNGDINRARFNKLLSLSNPGNNQMVLKNCDFSRVDYVNSSIPSLFNENGVSPTRQVSVENSSITNVKRPTVSGVEITASQAFINGSQYSNMRYYANNADATAAGILIPGNLYVNASGQIIQYQ